MDGHCTGPAADEMIHRSITGMVEELQPNLWERELRRSADFGHSFSPLIEMRALPELLHGEVVALDCVLSSFLAHHRDLLSTSDLIRVVRLVASLELPPQHPMFADPAMLAEALADTVRHRDGQQNLPLPNGIGKCVFVNDVMPAELGAASAAMSSYTDGLI